MGIPWLRCSRVHSHESDVRLGWLAQRLEQVLLSSAKETAWDFLALRTSFSGPQKGPAERGEAFLLTVGAFLLTVKLLCLQSLKALLRRTFPL